ncbi:hypothetical protein HGRIS_013767 [Hohenbuehelia grisea]|uniref:Uncharacterized protein n=1 Tax=Hohenbuehelia grisea TaxID=104357 RepID=A0ABR3IWR5_9AGAR
MSTPPGIPPDDFVEVTKGGNEGSPWTTSETTRYYTSVFIMKNGKILLGLKKRGFGQGYYNGFGRSPYELELRASTNSSLKKLYLILYRR